MMDWKERLRIQCDLSSQSAVARKLGVSTYTVNLTLLGKYSAKNSKLEHLVNWHFGEMEEAAKNDVPDTSEDWTTRLAAICDKYSVPVIAGYLNVSHSALYMILGGKYTSNTKIRDKFLFKIGDRGSIPGLKEAKRKRLPIHRTKKLILDVVDAIFCGGLILFDELLEQFPKHSLSRTLNYLIRNSFIDLIKVEPLLHGPGRKPDKKAYKLSCDCPCPGIADICKSCPLGKELISLEQGCFEEEEEFRDAC